MSIRRTAFANASLASAAFLRLSPGQTLHGASLAQNAFIGFDEVATQLELSVSAACSFMPAPSEDNSRLWVFVWISVAFGKLTPCQFSKVGVVRESACKKLDRNGAKVAAPPTGQRINALLSHRTNARSKQRPTVTSGPVKKSGQFLASSGAVGRDQMGLIAGAWLLTNAPSFAGEKPIAAIMRFIALQYSHDRQLRKLDWRGVPVWVDSVAGCMSSADTSNASLQSCEKLTPCQSRHGSELVLCVCCLASLHMNQRKRLCVFDSPALQPCSARRKIDTVSIFQWRLKRQKPDPKPEALGNPGGFWFWGLRNPGANNLGKERAFDSVILR